MALAGHQIIVGDGSRIGLQAKCPADKPVAQNDFPAIEVFFNLNRLFDLLNKSVCAYCLA